MGSTNEALGQCGPFSFTLPVHLDSSSPKGRWNDTNVMIKSSEAATSLRQRCSSDSFLFEEQPSWLDDLLNDTETDVIPRGGHRRSTSDSYAYIGGASTAADAFALEEETKYSNQESSDKAGSGSQVKPSGSKADLKRSKQHNAHRSRVRKLQYIAHLERTVQILKGEGSQFSAELEFLEQQNMILTMENRALRQRLESISQEQIIKNWEQGMLEREIGRLQSLCHLQKQQHLQMQQPHNHQQHPKHRRNKSLDNQMIGAPVKSNDPLSIKGSVSSSFQI